MSQLAHVCQACEKRQPVCSGPCLCTVSGKDVFEHYRSGVCPLGKFTPEAIEAAKASGPKPIPREQWPRFHLWLARRRIPGEMSTADTAKRLAGKFGGERFKRLAKRFGVDCGCEGRYGRWAIEFQYPKSP